MKHFNTHSKSQKVQVMLRSYDVEVLRSKFTKTELVDGTEEGTFL